MKNIILILWASIFIVNVACAQTNQVASLIVVGNKTVSSSWHDSPSTNGYEAVKSPYYFLRTLDGKIYEVTRWIKKEPDYLYISYIYRGPAGGSGGDYQTRISYDLLPKDIFDYYKFDDKKAKKFRSWRIEEEYAEAKDQAEFDEKMRKEILESQAVFAAQDSARAMQEQADQQRRLADATWLQARAAMIQATNPAQINVNQTVNTSTKVIQVQQVQQNQQNNYFW